MELNLLRFSSSDDDTLGILYIDGIFECFILEDEYREIKVDGETRIPEGIFKIKLRGYGRLFKIFSERWDWHHETLELVNVPQFTDILIHPGTTEEDTDGCLLTGDVCYTNQVRNGHVGRSRIAYERLYKKVYPVLKRGDEVYIKIRTICGKTF